MGAFRTLEEWMLYPLVQPTLVDLMVLCEEAGDGYLAASRAVIDCDLATLFITMAQARRAMAVALARHMETGIPLNGRSVPDTDVAHRLFGRLRAVLVGDPRRTLIERCERADRAFARCLAEVCGPTTLPPETRNELRLFLGEVTAALGLLAAARVRLS